MTEKDVEFVRVVQGVTMLYDQGEEIEHCTVSECESFRLKHFKRTRLTIDLDLIGDPDLTSRDIDAEHITNLYNHMLVNGFQDSAGCMSVGEKPTNVDDEGSKLSIENGRILSRVVVVDGRHRRINLLRLKQQLTEWAEVTSNLPVTLWSRRDDKPLSNLDILGIGAFLNDQSSNVKKPDFKDRVQAGISTVKALNARTGTCANNVSLRDLAVKMLKAGTLGSLDYRQVYRYAQLSYKLAVDEAAFAVFMNALEKHRQLGCTHFASNVLLDLNKEGFCLGVQVLCRRFEMPLNKPFRDIRMAFYTCLNMLYTVVENAAKAKDISVDSLLSREVAFGGDQKVSLRESVCQQMLRFNPTRQQAQADKRRASVLRARIVGIVGELPDPLQESEVQVVQTEVTSVLKGAQPRSVARNSSTSQKHASAAPEVQQSASPSVTQCDCRRSSTNGCAYSQ